MKAKLGQIVHFVLNVGPNKGSHRAAMVVGVKDERTVNLQVFADGTKSASDYTPNVFYKPGAEFDADGAKHGSWHFEEPE